MSDPQSLSDASSAALASLSAPDAAPVDTPAEPQAQELAVDATPATAPVAVEQPPLSLIDVEVDGKTYKVQSEAKDGYLRQSDYTRKTQEVAEQRRALEQFARTMQEREQQLEQFLSNREAVQAYLTQMQAEAAAQTPQNPQELVSYDQVRQLQEQTLAQVQHEITSRQQQAENERVVDTYRGEIGKTIAQALDKHPLLKDVDGIDILLQRDVAARNPASIQDVVTALGEAAEARAMKLQSRFTEMQKQRAASAAQLATSAIEPPGGTAVTPAPAKYKLGDKGLSEAAIAWVQSQTAARR